MDINNITITGRAVDCCNFKTIESKKGAFTIAIGRIAVDCSKEKTCFFTYKVNGGLAEKVAIFIAKGKRLAICGKLITDEYKKDGKNEYFTYIQVEQIVFLDKLMEGVKA